MRRRHRVVVLALAVITAFAGCVHRETSGEPFAPWDLRGTIVEASSDQVRVRHKSGQVVELTLDDRTAIVGAEGRATMSALTHGRRVVVHVEPLRDGHARAASIHVFM